MIIIVNISELEKGNGELYMQHGNLDLIIKTGLEKTLSTHSGQEQNSSWGSNFLSSLAPWTRA